MENASKALLMAGGMLLVVLIMSVMAMVWNNMREIPKTQEQIKEAEELAAFNKKYESYAKNGIRGTDVLTIANMAISNNDKYNGEATMQIKVSVTMNENITGEKIHYKDGKEHERIDLSGSQTIEAKEYVLTDSSVNMSSPFNTILNPKTRTVEGTRIYIKGENDLTEVDPKKESTWNWTDYWMKSELGAEFKRKKFNCQITNYDNGRVSEVTIKEQ